MWQNTVICDVGTAQCEDDTIKCEKKINEPPNVAKYSHMWYRYCIMWGWYNQMWGKKKRNHQMWQNIVTCDVGIVQCENCTIKCEKNK